MNRVSNILIGLIILISTCTFAQNPNFHIYLCFGQSNMEGQGTIEAQDQVVNSRFKTFQSLTCSNLSRTKSNWYTATPPTCQCYSKLSPADYFGRTMVANLPDSITVGIINVSVSGCDIRLFDKDIYMNYDSTYTASWFTSKVIAYGGNPYQHLVDLAKQAQQDGVIKGILLHQGETNTGQTMWLSYVKKIYRDMLADLSMNANQVPLLAGQMYSGSSNCCSSMISIVNRLPDSVATAHVISSANCPGQDNAHFNSVGYRMLGRRYAVQMLSLMGYKTTYAEPECGNYGTNLVVLGDNDASNQAYVQGLAGSGSSGIPMDANNMITMTITLPDDTTYYLYARCKNSSSASDAFWIKLDDGSFELFDNLTTNGWEWKELKSLHLSSGVHTITIAVAEEGAQLDKLALKASHIIPVSIGEEMSGQCQPVVTSVHDYKSVLEGYSLNQNYPNPATGGSTTISFSIPKGQFVSLKIFNSNGVEIQELAGKYFASGEHNVVFYPSKILAPGTYYYSLTAGEFKSTRGMIIGAK